MSDNVLAIDAGTTNVLAMILGADGRVLGRAVTKYELHYPAPGLVEQDPEELWSTTSGTISEALKKAGLAASDLGAVGITGQRSTIIIWERASGKTLGPAISWQDQRGTQRASELAAQGFPVDQRSAASKLESALDSIADGRERVGKGELAFGNVDSFLAWRLSGGRVHATDCSQACTTGYYDFFAQTRNDKLIELQGLDPSLFPDIVDTSSLIGATSARSFGAEVPIGAIVGDQQSAVYGQGCLKPGEGKVTFGTSGTGNINTGPDLKLAAGTYPLILWRRDGELTWCIEGMVITAGAVFDWLVNGLGIMDDVTQAAEMAGSVQDSHGVYFLPALQGLGSPHNQPEKHGTIAGLTLGASDAHIVRAAMEGVAFRVREMLDSVYTGADLPEPESLRVDGGASANDVLMQILANALGRPVERMNPIEATAFGAALLAGEACGVWEPWSTSGMHLIDRVFEPEWNEEEREEKFDAWRKALYPELD